MARNTSRKQGDRPPRRPRMRLTGLPGKLAPQAAERPDRQLGSEAGRGRVSDIPDDIVE